VAECPASPPAPLARSSLALTRFGGQVWVGLDGQRMLGVPAAVDRLIGQARAQVLTPIFDPHFHPCSVGFSPERLSYLVRKRHSAHAPDPADGA
jgi:hypothetical protein